MLAAQQRPGGLPCWVSAPLGTALVLTARGASERSWQSARLRFPSASSGLPPASFAGLDGLGQGVPCVLLGPSVRTVILDAGAEPGVEESSCPAGQGTGIAFFTPAARSRGSGLFCTGSFHASLSGPTLRSPDLKGVSVFCPPLGFAEVGVPPGPRWRFQLGCYISFLACFLAHVSCRSFKHKQHRDSVERAVFRMMPPGIDSWPQPL